MFFPPEWVTDIRRARPRADLVGYGGCDDFGFLFSFFFLLPTSQNVCQIAKRTLKRK